MDKVLTRQLKVYCPQHQAIFEVAESPKIVCEIKEHALSNSFPREEFWEYCCDCQTFFPSQLVFGEKSGTACLQCERPTLSRFLCNVCNVLTFDSGENTKDKKFHLSLEKFAIMPSCPGCLADFTAKILHLHKCAEIRAVLETSREICPFCKRAIIKKGELDRLKNESLFHDIKAEQKDFREEVKNLREAVKIQNGKIEQQQKIIQSLQSVAKVFQLEIGKLQESIKLQNGRSENLELKAKKENGTIAVPPPIPVTEPRKIINQETRFPVSVENYLRKVRFLPDKASADVTGGLLVQNSKKDAEFLIIKDSALVGDLFYALPAVTKFGMKSEYLVHYQNYYNCKELSVGEILILSPAIVRRVKDGWQLKQKGALEIKQTNADIQLPPKISSIKPGPEFPVSVETYLNKFRHLGQKALVDWTMYLLVQDPNKGEEFIIFKNSVLEDGLFYAMPSFSRFPTKSGYLAYYQSYYNCKKPAGGELWIISPAIVRRVKDGWKLEQKGELEMR